MNFSSAILYIPTKCEDIVIAAFDHKVVFGRNCGQKFETLQCFEINHNHVCEVFRGLFYIIKAYSKNSSDTNGSLCKKSASILYTWKIEPSIGNEPTILLIIQNNGNECYKLSLTIVHFNDIVLLLGNLILPSLNLSESANSVFEFILQLELEHLLQLKNAKSIDNLLLKNKNLLGLTQIEIHRISILVYYHLDVIIAIHTTKSLYNPELSLIHKNIDLIVSCK